MKRIRLLCISTVMSLFMLACGEASENQTEAGTVEQQIVAVVEEETGVPEEKEKSEIEKTKAEETEAEKTGAEETKAEETGVDETASEEKEEEILNTDETEETLDAAVTEKPVGANMEKTVDDKKTTASETAGKHEEKHEEKHPDKHSHSWSGATCYVAATCECGETKGSPLGHFFGNNEKTCYRCGTENPDYVAPHVHEWNVESYYTLNHTNEGHYAGYICNECGADYQTYEELDAHQEATAELSRTQSQWDPNYSYEDKSTWYLAHGGFHNGWIVEREWDVKAAIYTEVCSCGSKGKTWSEPQEVTCTCIHYGPDMHYHFADRACCNSRLQ